MQVLVPEGGRGGRAVVKKWGKWLTKAVRALPPLGSYVEYYRRGHGDDGWGEGLNSWEKVRLKPGFPAHKHSIHDSRMQEHRWPKSVDLKIASSPKPLYENSDLNPESRTLNRYPSSQNARLKVVVHDYLSAHTAMSKYLISAVSAPDPPSPPPNLPNSSRSGCLNFLSIR